MKTFILLGSLAFEFFLINFFIFFRFGVLCLCLNLIHSLTPPPSQNPHPFFFFFLNLFSRNTKDSILIKRKNSRRLSHSSFIHEFLFLFFFIFLPRNRFFALKSKFVHETDLQTFRLCLFRPCSVAFGVTKSFYSDDVTSKIVSFVQSQEAERKIIAFKSLQKK